jgi:4-amino-4-deoxy-L-arabinose transferase-like glycosyltransferase
MTRVFWVILFIALLLRLVFAFADNPANVRNRGGDELWYLGNGLGLYQAEPMGYVYSNFPYAVNALPSAPLYLLITGGLQLVFSLEDTVRVLWVLQSLAGVLTCYAAYRIAWKLGNDERLGLVVGTILAFSPVMIFEPRAILTESFYLLFLLIALWLYIEKIAASFEKAKVWHLIIVAGFLGLATLTRATSLLFPLGLVGHLLLVAGWKYWKRGISLALVLLLVYSMFVSIWTIFNWVNYQRLVIGSEQLTPSFWRGAVEGDGSPRQNDEMLGEESHGEQAVVVIASDPLAYVKRRVAELVNAYLQPHGTLGLGGNSLKAMAENWIKSGFSWDGFLILINGEGFWPKLIIYIFHATAILGGLWGMWLSRMQWKIALPLIGFIVYTSFLHLVVLALPRYIFPTYPVYWIFAALSLVWLWDKLKGHTESMPPIVTN